MHKNEDRRTVTFTASIWYSGATRHIHIARPGEGGFISTVSPDIASARSHPHLYRKLAAILQSAGVPAPDTNPTGRPPGRAPD